MINESIAPQAAAFIDLWKPQFSSTFSWELTAVLCVFISVAFSAIAYMLASAFKSEETKKWAKGELFFAFTNVFLIAFLILFMTLIGGKMMQFSEELVKIGAPDISSSFEGKDPIAFPLYYVEKMTECLRVAYIRNYCFNSVLEAVFDTRYDFKQSPGVDAPGTLANTVTAGIINSSHILSVFLTNLLQMFYLQKHLLYFLNGTMLTVFLPLGVVLRTFMPTRGPGNLFVALAIGFGVVFPLSYGMILAIRGPNIQQVATTACGITSGTPSPSGGVFTCASMMAGSASASAVLLPFTLLPKIFSSTIFSKWVTFAATSAPLVAVFYNQTTAMAQELVQYAVLYPIIALAIALTFVRSFTIFLGADAQDFLKGISRLI